MQRHRRIFILTACCLLAFGSHSDWAYGDPTKEVAAEATILVVPNTPIDPFAEGAEARSRNRDYLAKHLVMFRSAAIAGNVLQNPAVKSFAAGTEFERTMAIQRALKIRRHADASDSILVVSFTAPSEDQAIAILNVLLGQYKSYLDETYRSSADRVIELLRESQRVLSDQLEAAEQKMQEFRMGKPMGKLTLPLQSETLHSNLAASEKKLKAAEIAIAEKEARLSWIENAMKNEEQSIGLGLKLNDWAERSGFAKLPKETRDKLPVAQAYASALRLEIDEDRAVEAAILPIVERDRKAVRELRDYEFQDDRLRNRVLQIRELLSVLTKRVSELQLAKDFTGYEMRVLEKPRVKK